MVYPRFSYRWITNVPVGVKHSSEEKEGRRGGDISQEEHVEKTRSYGWKRNPFREGRGSERRNRGLRAKSDVVNVIYDRGKGYFDLDRWADSSQQCILHRAIEGCVRLSSRLSRTNFVENLHPLRTSGFSFLAVRKIRPILIFKISG